MKKNLKHTTKSKRAHKAKNAKAKRMFSTANLLIAVVAIIQCLILVSLTTYSWIESSSSLIISTGEGGTISMDVSKNLNYEIDMATDATGPANMSTFYNDVKFFSYAKVSSPDGKDMYFPKTNDCNTANASSGYNAVSGYRKGDTTDYNIGYTYFDFKLKNSSGMVKQFFFAPGLGTEGAGALFYATGGSSNTINQTVQRAMRISFTQDDTTVVYSMQANTIQTVKNTAGSLTTGSERITTKAVSYSVFNDQDPDITDKAIFEASTDGSISDVSVRIWLEEKALGDVTPAQLAAVKVNVNLKLICDNIVYDQIYFDDYGFSQTVPGAHLTEESDVYRMYFYTYNTQMSRYIAYPMSLTENENDPSIPRWVTSCPVENVFRNLVSGGNSTYYNNSFFGYGEVPSSTGSTPDPAPVYRWNLSDIGNLAVSGAVNSEDAQLTDATKYIASFGAAKASASPATSVGCAKFLNNLNPTMVYFNDYTTAYTAESYNASTSAMPNFRYIKEYAINASTGTRNQVMYTTNALGNDSKFAIPMYYDATTELFKAYVPNAWYTSGLKFKYCRNGYYSATDTMHWSAAAGSGEAVYTALGYSATTSVAALKVGGTGAGTNNLAGIGTWGAAREISISTELIDSNIAGTNKIRISIDNGSNFYWMYPDAARLRFTAYIPASQTTVKFRRTVDSTNTTWTTTGTLSDTDITYYPVNNSTGYFHLGVLVDGTYENLIYDTMTDGDSDGKLQYSLDGSSYTDIMVDSGTAGTPATDTNRIDNTRWYVPCNAGAVIYYRWTPYKGADGNYGTADDTVFNYIQYENDGLYYIVTE